MAWAWDAGVRPGLKLVLLALADHADNAGRCWPGIDGIAKKTGMSGRQVKRCVAELSEGGLIEIDHRAGNGSGRKTSVYVLTMQSDTMSPCGQSDTMSPCGKVTFATGQSDICDRYSNEEPSIEPSIHIPPVSPVEKKSSKKSSAESKAVSVEIPGWVDPELWSAYEDMRKLIRKPMTDYARKLALDKLAMLQAQGSAPSDVLKQSIENSYQGLFKVRNNAEGRRNNESASQRHARVSAAIHSRTERALSG